MVRLEPSLGLIYDEMVKYYHQEFRLSKSHRPAVAEKKAMFATIARHYGYQCIDIRDFMGWRNHGSVSTATKTVRGFIDVYPKVRKEFVEILQRVDEVADTRRSNVKPPPFVPPKPKKRLVPRIKSY